MRTPNSAIHHVPDSLNDSERLLLEPRKESSHPLLGQDAEEAQKLTYAGRPIRLLKESKTFDDARLEQSPLFKPHERQGRLI